MPCTIELFLVTVVFVIDLAYAAFRPPPGESISPQKAEIRWATVLLRRLCAHLGGLRLSRGCLGSRHQLVVLGRKRKVSRRPRSSATSSRLIRTGCFPRSWPRSCSWRPRRSGTRGWRGPQASGAGRSRHHARRHRALLRRVHGLGDRDVRHPGLVPLRAGWRERDRHGRHDDRAGRDWCADPGGSRCCRSSGAASARPLVS